MMILLCGLPGCRWLACGHYRCWLTGVSARAVRAGLLRVLCGMTALGGYGPAASWARLVRRRLRVRGGRPAAARRALSVWRAWWAVRMRWLRMTSRQASHSVSGVRPVSRHQPRAMLLLAVSLMVALTRSALVRRW